jgi:hypothetical protein
MVAECGAVDLSTLSRELIRVKKGLSERVPLVGSTSTSVYVLMTAATRASAG